MSTPHASLFLCVTLGLSASHAAAQAPYWRQVTTIGPAARSGHAMVYDSQRRVTVLFGGYAGPTQSVFDDTWEWNGSVWTQRTVTGPRPLARTKHAMAYDSRRGVVVLFGGIDPANTAFDDTWEWNGSAWTLGHGGGGPPNSPLPRFDHAMAYDIARGVTVLFGGDQSQSPTWEWNGTGWTRVTLVGPQPRVQCAMVWDEQRRVCVMFGGLTGFADCRVWEWNGAVWTSPGCVWGDSPWPWTGHAMAYDTLRGMVVRHGGWSGPDGFRTQSAATLESAGYLPSMPCTSCSPGPRSAHAMVYDSARHVTVLFGGDSGFQDRGDTWEWSGFRSHDTGSFGNPCGTPPLLSWTDSASPPVLGTTARLQIRDVPGPLASVALGLRNDVLANSSPPLPLPVSLAPLGMLNCWLLTSSEYPTNIVGATNGAGVFALPLPSIPSLVGHHLYLQAWAPAPGMNPAGVIFSNAHRWVLGNQ